MTDGQTGRLKASGGDAGGFFVRVLQRPVVWRTG